MDITIHSPAPFTWNARSMVSHWESKRIFLGPETPLDVSSQCKGTVSCVSVEPCSITLILIKSTNI